MLELTDQNFQNEVLKNDGLVLVDFWAPWCGPCKMMGPVIDELAKDNEGKAVKIAKMNVDTAAAIAGNFGIMSIPTFLFFKNGNVVDQMNGAVSKGALQEKIDKHIE